MDCETALPPIFSNIELVTYVLPAVTSSVIGILANILVLLSIYTFDLLKECSMYFLVGLSLTDLGVNSFVQVFTIIILFIPYEARDHCWFVMLLQLTSMWLCTTSAVILTMISYDRYLHMSKLKNYNKHMSKKKVIIMLLVANSLGIMFGVSPLLGNLKIVFYIVMNTFMAALFLTLVSFYYKSWNIVKKHSQGLHSQISSTSDNNNIAKLWKTAKAMLLLVVVFGLSWLPYMLCINLHFVLNIERNLYISLCVFATLIGLFNSTINPFLYYWKNKKLRKCMNDFVSRKILRRKVLQNKVESGEGNI